jgi:hypothetical protein
MAAVSRDIGAGALEVGGQCFGAQFLGDAEPAEMLHRTAAGRVAFGVRRGFDILRDENIRHAAPIEFDRGGQPDWTAADNQRESFIIHIFGWHAATNLF